MGNYSPHYPGLVKCRYKVSVPGHYWVTTALRVVSEIRGPEIRCFTCTIACVILPGLCVMCVEVFNRAMCVEVFNRAMFSVKQH